MSISDVRIRIVKKECSKLRAVASITFDESFVVHDIKIIDGIDGVFIAMPSRKTADGDYKDVAHPINQEKRDEVVKIVLDAYWKEVQKEKELEAQGLAPEKQE